MKILLAICLFLLSPLIAFGADKPSASPTHTQIAKLAASFVKQQTAGISGKVDYQIEGLDPRISLTPCSRMEAFLPSGSQLIGKTSIGVRCNEQNGWQILVPIRITVTLQLLVSARQLQPGQVLQSADITAQSVEISRATGFTDPAQVVGKVLRYGVAAGQILRDDMLRAPYSVTQGQVVQIIARGIGFSIRNEGVALSNAGEGQTVQIRVASGRVVAGTARNGIVEIAP
ncbi:MAG: flagella basal body P-ring formation protein FlgA [Gallionellales bacterium GWA2_60_142]|jgi:flagella basal body P-ring formation protein FlgA|nr:MAG: flagella basal body P-ring formation protein FlgA [Gallionellales bacterium GWA2_60_142]HCI13432.1 flagellar basal body P-ring formation protein FlgA [Gallionellaceae bacterium]